MDLDRETPHEFFFSEPGLAQMAANRTAYLLSHAAAQADRSHRPECDDGSPRTELPPHFGAPPPRSWALPPPPGS